MNTTNAMKKLTVLINAADRLRKTGYVNSGAILRDYLNKLAEWSCEDPRETDVYTRLETIKIQLFAALDVFKAIGHLTPNEVYGIKDEIITFLSDVYDELYRINVPQELPF